SAGRDKTVRVWDVESHHQPRILKGHAAGALAVAFSPDGKRIASASQDGMVKLWDAESDHETRTLAGQAGDPVLAMALAFSPDGRRLVSTSDMTLRVWDVANGREIRSLMGHTYYVNAVAFSADGRRIVSASADHMVKAWDPDPAPEALTIPASTSRV